MKKGIIFSIIIGLSSIMTWAIYTNSTNKSLSLKKDKEPKFILSDTQRICINEFLKIQKFYTKNKIFRANLFKSISPDGGTGEQMNIEVLADGNYYFMDSKIGSVVNNDDFFAQIDYESNQVVIGSPISQNPIGFKFKDFNKLFKDSLMEVSFKKNSDLATISYSNLIENTITDISYHFLTGEIIRITETFYDYWEEEDELTKITEDCIVRSFKPLSHPISLTKFKLTDCLEQKDSVFLGKGICKGYEIEDTRYKY